MPLKIVIHPAVEVDRLEVLREAAPSDSVWVNAATAEEAGEAIADADAMLGKITPEILARAGCLRWVQSFTAGLERYIFPELVEHPCTLTNMRGLFSDVIAEQVLGYVLCFARNLHTYVRQQIEHRYEPLGGEENRIDWAAGPSVINAIDRATIDLSASTLGVVGFGAAGREIARRATVFGMTVLGVDRIPERVDVPEGVEAVWGVDRLPDLLGRSDFLVIVAPQTPETEGLFDAARIRAMKPGSYLINVGRGPIVRLDAVVEALRDGHLAGAALDVYQVEPLPSDHPLWDEPRAILTPHTAGYSTKVAGRHLATLVENVHRFSVDEPLINVVDKRLWF